MLRMLFRGTRLLQGAIATIAVLTLLGCEEISSKPDPAPLYREIGYEELKERWADYWAVQGVYGGEPSASKLHASTFDALPSEYVFEDAREYGSCVAFTVALTLRFWVVDDPDDPDGWKEVDADHPGAVMREETETVHVLDCVGEPAPGNRVTEGLFHAAALCEDQMHLYVLWTGRFSPQLHFAEGGENIPLVTASMSVSPFGIERTWDSAQWVTDVVTETGDTVVWNAATIRGVGNRGVMDLFGFASLGGADEMRFSIGHSVGVVPVQDNDEAALIEYRRRCATT